MDKPQSLPGVVTLSNDDLTVQIAELGAELVRLQDGDGHDYLWNGDPAYWKGKAPLLFPMVGRAVGDRIRVNGAPHPLPQHGFARVTKFELVETSPARCMMRLLSSDATLPFYPFEFRLDVLFELHGRTLLVTAIVRNDGPGDLPCSFGFHPAFRWPLPGAIPGEPHEITFDQSENEPILRLVDGLLDAKAYATPVVDRRLALNSSLFEQGALIFDQLASRSVTYGAATGPAIEIAFPDMPHLGLWTKPGANFICIEPWQGFASPEGYDEEFADRPGVISIPPNAERDFQMTIHIRPASKIENA